MGVMWKIMTILLTCFLIEVSPPPRTSHKVSLCNFGACPGTSAIEQAGLELTEIHLPLTSDVRHCLGRSTLYTVAPSKGKHAVVCSDKCHQHCHFLISSGSEEAAQWLEHALQRLSVRFTSLGTGEAAQGLEHVLQRPRVRFTSLGTGEAIKWLEHAL